MPWALDVLRLALAAGLLLAVAGCSGPSVEASRVSPDLQRITPEQWQRLSQRAIYFGHQSVGENILDGIRDLASENAHIRLRIVSGHAEPTSAALHEFLIGQNGDVDSKNTAFLSATQGALGPRPVLMFKYCYVDMDAQTDAKRMFEAYRQTVSVLRAKHPQAVIVHVTAPLVAESSLFRYYINAVRGIPTTRDENARRNEYNQLLRSTYAGKEPVFDLAAAESTHADGRRSHVIVDGKPVDSLAPEWTDDGGHLNKRGRRRVAAQFLMTLAALPDMAAGPPVSSQ